MIKSKISYLLLIFSIFLYVSCSSLSGPEITLTAEPNEISAGGNEFSTITVILKEGGSLKSGGEIQFTTDNGSFSVGEELTETTVTTDDEGKAEVKLYSAEIQGQASVTAHYETSGGSTVDKSITVIFGPPAAADLPMAGNFHLDCDIPNIGALISTSKPDIRVHCQINARNIKGKSIPPEALNLTYQAEAGELIGEFNYDGDFSITYYVRGGNASPVDVEPDAGEPSRACGGKVCNPRDGLVTLIAITKGSEHFQDRNGNGVYDEGEPFDDLPEPFLDANDNGIWDEDEWYFDTDGNGEYSEGNAKYDDETMISAVYKIVWSGKPEESETAAWITYSPSNTSLPNGGSIVLTVNLVDKNLNPVAGFESQGDSIYFIESIGGLMPTQPASDPGMFPITNISAIELDENLQFLSFDENIAKYQVTFIDSDPSEGSDGSSWLIGVDTTLTPGPEGDSEEYNSYSFSFNTQVSGSVQ